MSACAGAAANWSWTIGGSKKTYSNDALPECLLGALPGSSGRLAAVFRGLACRQYEAIVEYLKETIRCRIPNLCLDSGHRSFESFPFFDQDPSSGLHPEVDEGKKIYFSSRTPRGRKGASRSAM